MTEKCNLQDQAEKLQIAIVQLEAALRVIHGEGLIPFDCLRDDIRDNYIWGLADKAADCARMADDLSRDLVAAQQGDRHD